LVRDPKRQASAKRAPSETGYRVFGSHAGDDVWVAEQIARRVEQCGATAFLDRRDIAAGDNFKDRIRDEIPRCQELLALFTPLSRTRAWVRHEIGMADMLGKRIVCVFYKVTMVDLRQDGDGLGPLEDLNVIDINLLNDYFEALAKRVRS
jgi:TIR domain